MHASKGVRRHVNIAPRGHSQHADHVVSVRRDTSCMCYWHQLLSLLPRGYLSAVTLLRQFEDDADLSSWVVMLQMRPSTSQLSRIRAQ